MLGVVVELPPMSTSMSFVHARAAILLRECYSIVSPAANTVIPLHTHMFVVQFNHNDVEPPAIKTSKWPAVSSSSLCAGL